MSNDGLERSAILLMSLGEEQAVEVFKHLGPREVQKLGQAMAKLSNVSRDQVAEVLREFRKEAEEQTTIGAASDEYLRSVLTRAIGNDRASVLIDRIVQSEDATGIESLRWLDSKSVAELIGNEHPQIIATILVHLDSDQASEVLVHFPERLRNDVVLRIATLEGVEPGAMRDLNDVLSQLLAGGEKVKKSSRGGIDAAAAASSLEAELRAVQEIARQEPRIVANVVKGWVGRGE